MSSDDDVYSDDGGYSDGAYGDDDDDAYDEGDNDDEDANASADGDDSDSNDDDDDEEDRAYSDDESEEDTPPLPMSNGGFKHIPQQTEKVYLEFDGASKGNPGRSGAGAVLKDKYGRVITRVSEGLGNDTNNGAEYKALIRGLKTAREKGYDRIDVQGDSELVLKQVQGLWQIRNDYMARLCKEARELISQFKEFGMKHVPRGYNTDADAAANEGVNLPAGRVQEEDNPSYRRRC